jgi:hypothetical protein
MHDGVTVEELIQRLDPLLMGGKAQFFFVRSAPFWNWRFIETEYPFIRVEIIAILRRDFSFGKFSQFVILVPAASGEGRVIIYAELPSHLAGLVNDAAKSFAHLFLSF